MTRRARSLPPLATLEETGRRGATEAIRDPWEGARSRPAANTPMCFRSPFAAAGDRLCLRLLLRSRGALLSIRDSKVQKAVSTAGPRRTG